MHHTISDYISELLLNSMEAQSSLIILDLFEQNGELRLYVSDNGTGMQEQDVKRVRDPFFTDQSKHRHRKVGLGLSFLSQLASQCEGKFEIESEKGVGTSVFFSCPLNHPDTPPSGDIALSVLSAVNGAGDYELKFSRKKGDESYTVLRSELLDAAGNLENAQALIAVRKYLHLLENSLLKEGK